MHKKLVQIDVNNLYIVIKVYIVNRKKVQVVINQRINRKKKYKLK